MSAVDPRPDETVRASHGRCRAVALSRHDRAALPRGGASGRMPGDQKPPRIRSGSFRSRFDAVPVKNPTNGSPSATQ
jgi:hypothetical protein